MPDGVPPLNQKLYRKTSEKNARPLFSGTFFQSLRRNDDNWAVLAPALNRGKPVRSIGCYLA
jgi:hypothetical protein